MRWPIVAGQFANAAAVAVLVLAHFCVAGAQGTGDPVACCAEARVFLKSIGQGRSPSAPLSLESNKKSFFIDDEVLDESKGLRRTLHQPKKYGAVLRGDRPWDGTVQTRTAPSWNPEKKLWMLWYFGAGGTAYATSPDGLHWNKPVLGIRDYKGSKENNLLSDPLSFVIYDPKDADPSRRYKALTTNGPKHLSSGGFYPATSPDGLHWKTLESAFVPSQDEANLFHDLERNLFVFTVKHPGPYGRSVYLTLSKDFVHWTDPRDCLIFHADKRDQELGRKWIESRFADPVLRHPEYDIPDEYGVQVYNMGVFRYGDIYLGLPAMFHQSGRVSKDWDGFSRYQLSPEILQAVRAYGDWTGFHHLQMASSRDLLAWQRVGDRQPFLDASPVDSGAYDLQTLMPAPPPIVRDGELWFYYTGIRRYAYVSSGEPDLGGICLARLRLDGFVSLDAGDAAGTAVTKPMVIAGASLHVNLDAREGDLRAEVLDQSGSHVLPGFSLDDSLLARGDRTDVELRWRSASLTSLKGRTCRLRFTLRKASLYAFWTQP